MTLEVSQQDPWLIQLVMDILCGRGAINFLCLLLFSRKAISWINMA